MDPGDYRTNVLSFNNFSSINYEYLEPSSSSPGTTKKNLQKIEAFWRQEGSLAHLDTTRDGIWIFQNGNTPTPLPTSRETESEVVEVQGIQLVVVEKGTFEPASLAKSRQITSSGLNSTSNNSSPSSSLENPGRNALALNSRSVQANSLHNPSQETQIQSPGQRSLSRQEEVWPSAKDIHDRFISAVLGSLVSVLCREEGFIPFNPRTLILNRLKSPSAGGLIDSSPADTVILATLDISLISLGTLVIKVYSNRSLGLQSLAASPDSVARLKRLTPGTSLWLAPGGNIASFYAAPNQKGLPKVTPGTQLSTTTPGSTPEFSEPAVKAWQSKCLEWLSTKGIDTASLEKTGWLFVRLLAGNKSHSNNEYQGASIFSGPAIVPWPALLCFSTSISAISSSLTNKPSTVQSCDPLTFAEDWFMGKSERGNHLLKRQKDRQMAEALSKEHVEVDTRGLPSNAYSPAVLRRGSNAGAMYPTPPDAIHHPVGATPVFDGAGSTPSNANHLVSQDPIAVAATSGVTDNDIDMWGPSGKKERSNDDDNDADLFGDLGGDMFGNDVTDADFSFFDEPDDVEPEAKVSSPVKIPQLAIGEDLAVKQVSAVKSESTDDMRPPPMALTRPKESNEQCQNGAMKPPRLEGGGIVTPHALKVEKETAVKKPLEIPFNQESIFQRLVKETSALNSKSQPSRRASLFDKVNFENSLSSVDEKYGANGLFRFSGQKRQKIVELQGLPQTKYLSTRKSSQINGREPSSLPHHLIENKQAQQNDEEIDDIDDSDSTKSEQDDASHTDETSPAPAAGFEKVWLGENGQDGVANFDPMSVDYEPTASTPHSTVGTQMPALGTEPTDWSLATYFTSPEPEMISDTLTDLECIATAQILVDQVVSGTLQLSYISGNETTANNTTTKGGLVRSVAKAARTFFKDFSSCTLRTFSEIPGVPVLSQGLRLPPRPSVSKTSTNTDPIRPNNPYPIPLPRLDLRRSDSKLSVLPSAVLFWENLGLAPSGGSKNVQAICVYPTIDGVSLSAHTFLEQMCSTYESYRLGNHDILVSKDLSGGLLPYVLDADRQNPFQNISALRDMAAGLAQALASNAATEKNFVVYFVYPPDNPALLVHICAAFQHLFHLYRKALLDRKLKPLNELVLQLVPLDFIASPTSIMVPLPSSYAQLCLEVYGRCMDFASLSSSPAIMLERPLPRTIDFKLNPTPSASVLQENSCLHIAYAQSTGDRWISAVWTDNRGTQQMTASYCLSRKNEPISTPFSHIANEIWDTTIDFMSSKKIHWRLLIARVGVMEPNEVELWTGLAARETDAHINLTLLTVQTDPSLRLLPPPIALGTREQTATPVSTPQGASSILSPDISTTTPSQTATTPSDLSSTLDPDPSTRLLNLTDQTHGLILSHRLSNSRSLVNPNPALISGYLIKHGAEGQTPALMEVNIIHSEIGGNPRTYYEGLLREVLVQYSGLGVIARSRGVSGESDGRPWHILGAERGARVCEALM